MKVNWLECSVVSLCYSLKYVMHHWWRLEFTSLNVICNTLVSLTDKQLILEEDRDGCYMHRMESQVIPDLLQDEIVSEQLTRYTGVRTLNYCFTLPVISWIVILSTLTKKVVSWLHLIFCARVPNSRYPYASPQKD